EMDGTMERLPKKEAARLRDEHEKLERFLGGIKEMPKLPAAVFIVDLKKERIALAEARKLDIPVVAIVDTNCDPDERDYVIPGNEEAIRSIRLLANKIADAIVEIRGEAWNPEEEAEAAVDGRESPVAEPEFGTAAIAEPAPLAPVATAAGFDAADGDAEAWPDAEADLPAAVYDDEEQKIEDALREDRERTEPDR